MDYIKQKLNNQKGSALVLILILTSVFGILGTSLLYTVNTNHKKILDEEVELQSYYAAETGVIYGVEEILNNMNNAGNISVPEINMHFDKSNLKYDIEVVKEDGHYVLKSTGHSYKNKLLNYKTEIKVTLDKKKPYAGIKELQGKNLFDYTIASEENLYLGQEQTTYNPLSFNTPIGSIRFNRDVILSNKMRVYGDIYSGENAYIYYGEKAITGYYRRYNYYNDDDDDKRYSRPQPRYDYFINLLGVRPELINTTIYTQSNNNGNGNSNNNVYASGYDLKTRGRFISAQKYQSLIDDNKVDWLANTGISTTDNNPFDDKVIEDLKDNPKLKTINGDLYIDDRNLDKLSGYLHVTGDLVIEEGVETEVRDLIVIVDGGIMIGAKAPYSRNEDVPVKIKGENILLLATGALDNKWRNYSPIKSLHGHSIPFSNSYRSKYYNNSKNWNDLSILTNDSSEVDGWIYGKHDVVFDYKEQGWFIWYYDNPLVKISGGIIAGKILFPEAIEVGNDDLYIYGWEVN